MTNLFIPFGIFEIIDILLVAVLLYQLYHLVRGTVAINIFLGVLSVYLLWKTVEAFHMKLLSEILGQFIGVGVIALLIVFQQELRRFLLLIGTTKFYRKTRLQKMLPWRWDNGKPVKFDKKSILTAVKRMAASKTGAILVISTRSGLSYYAYSGIILDAKLSDSLIETIFFKNSPLHDGAIIISGNRIRAAGCILPVSENREFPAQVGMRHRAAVGLTENTDAVVIVVSEETGKVSFSAEGDLKLDVGMDELERLLDEAVGVPEEVD